MSYPQQPPRRALASPARLQIAGFSARQLTAGARCAAGSSAGPPTKRGPPRIWPSEESSGGLLGFCVGEGRSSVRPKLRLCLSEYTASSQPRRAGHWSAAQPQADIVWQSLSCSRRASGPGSPDRCRMRVTAVVSCSLARSCAPRFVRRAALRRSASMQSCPVRICSSESEDPSSVRGRLGMRSSQAAPERDS